MEIIINDIEKANAILTEYKGAKVQFWSFNKFHEKIELLIDFADNENVLFITFISCKKYSGDLYWLDSELKISRRKSELDDQWIITKISDSKTGFYIECLGQFVLKKGSDKEFLKKFNSEDDDEPILD
jgi:hypothetical protein